MKLLRNPELRRAAWLYALVSAAACAAAFMWQVRFGAFTLCLCALLGLIALAAARRRDRRIAALSAELDRILHGEEQLSLAAYAEGELSILQSEIYKMTVRLREQQQRLQDDKLYLAESLADISHQLRTPLTSINLLVSRLSDPSLPDERRKKLTHELYALLSRVDWLITALLKLSRLDAGTVKFAVETVPLAALLEKSAAPLLVPMELRGQTLRLSAEGDFSGDTAWTAEAVTNIIKNCMEHTPESGTVEVRASENALFTQIVISDDGCGIAPEDLPHIFERFYKGKDSGDRSFGIGLALARRIVTAQNGTLKAENRAPHGAEFTLRFYKGVV